MRSAIAPTAATSGGFSPVRSAAFSPLMRSGFSELYMRATLIEIAIPGTP